MRIPSGTVTFLFTDIEGSTRLWEEHPEGMGAALSRHNVLVREAIETSGGYLFKTVGDSVCAAFARASEAVVAACEAQRSLQAEDWAGVGPLPVRVALYTGEVEQQDGDYLGPPLNQCARILAAAHGGQVLLSQTTTAGLIEGALPEGLTLGSLGQHRLRDLVRPEELFQLGHPNLPSDFPPLRSLAAFTHNLPAQVTDLIGREAEIAEVRARLGETRLLTLTGTGGAGKTRLAMQVGAELLDTYPDGVWFVELASISDPALVPQALLSTLGIREEPQKPLLETAIGSLRGKRVLLILDNCEHLVDVCAELASQVLAACPDVRLLATSREALRAEGEVLWRVPSLPVPERTTDAELPVSALTQYAATRLFMERAKAVQPDFTVTDANAPAVAEICRRLDGIPLAIELAAARVDVLSPREIEHHLDDRFRLLAGGLRTALPRHRALRAAVDWSDELLEARERLLLRRVSVFAGGWTLEAGEALCSDADRTNAESRAAAIGSFEVFELLAHLVRKSLVMAEEHNGKTRYRLLETLREYYAEKLSQTGEADPTRDRHAAWFLSLVEQAEPELDRQGQQAWLERLAREHDNLRAALEWSLETQEVESALRFVEALWRFLVARCHLSEGRRWLTRIASGLSEGSTSLRAKALSKLATLAWLQDDHREARELGHESMALAQRSGDLQSVPGTLRTLGYLASQQGDYEKAEALLNEGLALAQDLGDRESTARLLDALGVTALHQGHLARADSLLSEALALCREGGYEQHIGYALSELALVARHQGHTERAGELAAASLATARKLQEPRLAAYATRTMGEVARLTGDCARASALHREGLQLLGRTGDKYGLVLLLEAEAKVLCTQGRAARAARLFGATEALREAIASPLPPVQREEYEGSIAAARKALGDEAFEAAWAAGAAMRLDEAVAYALEEDHPGATD